MTRPSMAVLLGALLLTGACGCYDFSKYSKNYGKVEMVQVGWHINDVVNKIGKPLDVKRGKGLRLNWQEMIYPGGSVFLYRMRVQKVLKRSYLKEVPTEEEQDKEMMRPYREENIFEDKKKDVLSHGR